jgi:hypothetical protein
VALGLVACAAAGGGGLFLVHGRQEEEISYREERLDLIERDVERRDPASGMDASSLRALRAQARTIGDDAFSKDWWLIPTWRKVALSEDARRVTERIDELIGPE